MEDSLISWVILTAVVFYFIIKLFSEGLKHDNGFFAIGNYENDWGRR
jgi:hypothetical protein